MRTTQCEKIMRHLQDFGSITQMEALKEYGIARLASRISDLKKRGERITATTEYGKNRYGDACHWAKYSLEKAE